jgi:gliding motility-associated-like protein
MKKLSLLLALILGFTAFSAKASHQSAADIYYDYISPLKYRVHLIIYRDCTGVGQGGTETISVWSESLGQTSVTGCNVTLDTTGNGPTGIEVGDICPGIGTKCTNPASIFNGYEEWHYSGIVDLPAVAKDWKFQWSSCCRNPAILNIPQNSMTVYALLNNVDRPVNSSVRLSQKPIPYVCVNVPYLYVNGPFDPDGDLVNCVNSIPLDNGTGCTGAPDNPYTYNAPYTLALPLPTGAPGGPVGYNVGLTTGTASFTPNATGAYVLSFRFYDIDNGDTLGMSMRDVQLNVENCIAGPPSPLYTLGYNVTNVVGGVLDTTGGVNTITICPGIPLSFDVSAFTTSGSNNLVGLSNNASACPGSTVVYSPPAAAVSGSFSWIPPGTASNNTLIFEFDDSTCTITQPIVLSAYIIVNLKVLPGVSGGGPYNYCPGGDPLTLISNGPDSMNSWSWNALPGTLGNPNFIGGNTGTSLGGDTAQIAPIGAPPGIMYIAVTGLPSITGCANIDTVQVNIYDSLILSAGPDKTVCANDPVVINGTVNNPNGSVTWSPTLFLTNTASLTPTCVPLASQGYKLSYTDPNGCKGSDSVTVFTNGVKPILNAIAERDTVCPNIPFQLFSNASAQPCGISRFQCNASSPSTFKSVGNGTFVNANFSPFTRDFNSGFRTQYLYKAAELKQAGLEAGIISSLQWDVLTNASASPLIQYRVKMGCTGIESFSTTTGFVAGLPTVFAAPTFSPTLGLNTINFQPTTEFFWDGSSNIVVEVCYSLPLFSGGVPSEVSSMVTPFNSSISYTDQASACTLPATVASIAGLRPNTKFKSCPVSLFNYAWTPAGSFANNTVANPLVQNGITNTTTFTVNAVSATNPSCTASDVVTVSLDFSGTVNATATPAHLCEPGLVTLSATPGAGTTPPQYRCGEENVSCIGASTMISAGAGNLSATNMGPWSSGYPGQKTQWMFTPADLAGYGITPNSQISNIGVNVVFNSGTTYNNFNIRMGCSKAPNLSGLQSSLEFKDVYNAATYAPTFGWNTFNFSSPFVWDGTSNLIVEMCYFNGTFNFNTTDLAYHTTGANIYEVEAASFSGGCDLPFSGTVDFQNTRNIRPDTRFTVCQVAPKPFTYIWDNPISGQNVYYYDTTKQTTTAYVPYNSTYQVSLLNRTGCKRSDTVQVRIELHDITVSPEDTAICPGDRFIAYAVPTGTDPNPTLLWTPTIGLSCSTCYNPEVAAPNTIQYSVIRSDVWGCKDTATLDVLVHPNPNVVISQGDSIVVPFNASVPLDATGAYVYTWSPSWALSTTNQSSTIITPQQPGLYYVHALDTNGCKNHDSIYVDVNYRSPVFIANSFTPNGDGVNDFFGVTNLKFQKIQEFRVFNRFGNEVFSTNDAKGWDGTYRGKAAEMDTYKYFIKLAFPDGFVDTYKGDVILIR